MPIVPYRLRLNNEPEITKRCTPQFNTDLISSTQKSVNSTNPLVQRKNRQFNTEKSVQNPKIKSYFLLVFCVELTLFCVERTLCMCCTDAFVLNRRFFFVEMKNLGGWKRVTFLCWTDVMNCLVCATAGDPVKIFGIFN